MAKMSSPEARDVFQEGAIITDPDRPPVAAMPLNDAPLEVKSSEELPAGTAAFELDLLRE
jgi:hypothetical protein